MLASGFPPLTTGLTPAAIAMKPSIAISPSTTLNAGSPAMLRLIAERSRAANIAVITCG